MEVIILPTANDVCTRGAGIVDRLARDKTNAVIGLPTGETPKRMYQEIVRKHRQEQLDMSKVTTFNLDEFTGLPEGHAKSFKRYMQEQLFAHVPVKSANLPDGNAKDLSAECDRYEQAIRDAGGMDLVLLGIGEDGHIGFNEPSSSLASRTRLKTLTRQTLARSRFDARDRLPVHAITMGIATILDAKRCVLMAFGRSKARAVSGMVEGALSAMVPASALQMHPRATVLLDEEAAAELSLKDYYREVYRHKPDWQKARDGI